MARKTESARKTVKVDTVTHKDKRTNIPTEELRGFVAEDEKSPKTLLYPRDPSLDPQLVWKGKDEQDSKDLAVDVVPIYIQEKIHPQALIEDLRAHAKGDPETQAQMAMFADFNGIKFEHYIDFYKHGQKWQNRMILGDSLLVMASLAEKEGMKGKVQMVYMDPPYGSNSTRTGRCQLAGAMSKTARLPRLRGSPSRFGRFEILGASVSTRTSPTCGTV
jgi:adenine-specific DNA-methyltransferase